MMNEDFVPYELAVKLKEKGFRELCLYRYRNYSKTLHPNKVETKIARKIDYSEFLKCYNSYIDNDVDAPTISQVLKWLREQKKIHIVCPFYKDKGFYYYVQRIGNAARIVSSFGDSDDCFDTYEQAALAGIEYVLDNLI